MRKSIGLIALLMVAMAFVVAPASADEVDTAVEIGACENNEPVIKCKWEEDLSGCLEDGDPSHVEFEPSERNSWFLPECNKVATPINIYAVVADQDGISDVDKVYYKVTGPCGKQWGPLCMSPCGGQTEVEAAYAANLTFFATGYDIAEVRYEFDSCINEIGVYCVPIEIGYCDPAGEYQVEIWAQDKVGVQSNHLINNFTMLPLACCQFDFTSLTWNKMVVGDWDIISGDEDMATATRPSVENQGNVAIKIKVQGAALEDSTGEKFVKDTCGNYYYQYDAKLRDDPGSYICFWPEEANPRTLQGFVERCDIEALCFSLKILSAMDPGVYTGKMTVTCEDAKLDPCTYT